MIVVAGIVIGLVVGGIIAAAWIHHGYAWNSYQAAKAAVPPARRNWWARFVDLVRVLAVIALVLGILWAWGGRDGG